MSIPPDGTFPKFDKATESPNLDPQETRSIQSSQPSWKSLLQEIQTLNNADNQATAAAPRTYTLDKLPQSRPEFHAFLRHQRQQNQ